MELFTPNAIKVLRATEIVISPIVKLELQYLYEIGRIEIAPDKIVDSLIREVGLVVARDEFDQVIFQAMMIDWTRDLFDRIITAHAAATNDRLLTKDQTILENYPLAFWK
jgi:PIN domain nuclease of toxin-antitoxin system